MTGTVDVGGELPADVSDRLRALNATGPRILRHTDKATTVEAQWRGRRVVVKVLTTTDAYWRHMWQREGAAYAAFAAHAPPVNVPELLHEADGERVLSWIGGVPLHTARFPAEPLDPVQVSSALAALSSLARWSGSAVLPAADYRRMLDHASAGLDRDALAAIVAAYPDGQVGQHGDALPSNLMMTTSRNCALVDFEHAGRVLPGYDVAKLACFLADQPAAVRDIIDDAAADVEPACFAANLALAADHEARIHWAFEPDQERRRRLALLADVAAHARRLLRSAVG